MKNAIALLILVFFIQSCKKEKSVYDDISSEAQETSHFGKTLMEIKCYICHSPSGGENERVAPPMIAIKAHYIDEQTTKEEFTEAMLGFLEKPSKDNAKLKGAVKKFGVMPYQPFKEEDIKRIAEYMYDYEIEEPEWFKSHWEDGHGKKRKRYRNHGKKEKSVQKSSIEDIGLTYALETKKVLGQNLMGTIQHKGTLEALKFCNENAYPLTDSMSTHFDAKIRRVSDKPRNASNQANAVELEKIDYFKGLVETNTEIKPILEKYKEEQHFYYPILTNSMCMQCHGKREQINPEVLTSISTLYPNDLAMGYDVNEVRGIWSISFKNNQNE